MTKNEAAEAKLVRSARDLSDSLPPVAADRLDRMRLAARDRPIAYPLGSGQAEELALLAGLKPVLRQVLEPDRLAGERARFESLGLVVAETDCLLFVGGIEGHRVARSLYAGRDRVRVRAAAECDRRHLALFRSGIEGGAAQGEALASTRAQGQLLGYPPCCVEAFLAVVPPRPAHAAWRSALARTLCARPRLNVLDLSLFHFLPWLPCAFDCPRSIAWADAVGALVRAKHSAFLSRIDEALRAHRLVLLEDVQVSIEGDCDGNTVNVARAWPTGRDRHPAAQLHPDALEAAARVAALLEERGSVSVSDGVVAVGGTPIARTEAALLAQFGA